jgi:hypothetical protein
VVDVADGCVDADDLGELLKGVPAVLLGAG